MIVYPYHPNTAYAIKKIKECISDELCSNIIQLTPVRMNHSGSSFLFSPESFKRITTIIKKQPVTKREVIFFDDSLVSGRTRKEVKHILLNLKATKVKTLAILDRFRLPYAHQAKDRNRFFWRFDVPRLGVKNTNPITRALNIIDDFSSNLNEVTGERINQWQKAWGITSVYLDSPMNGIKPSKIDLNNPNKSFCLKYDHQKKEYHQISSEEKNPRDNYIYLSNSYGLTVNITEIHTLTGQDNRSFIYAMEKKGTLSKGAKIELLSSQLLLFPKEFPKENQYEMIKVLYDTLEEYKICNNHTIFAAITLLVQDEIYIKKLVKYIEEKHQASSYINCSNIDLRILLSYYIYVYKIENPRFNFVSNCIISNKSILSVYKRLHFELYQEREMHYSPIIALYKKLDRSLYSRLDNALHNLLNIRECINILFSVSYQRDFCSEDAIKITIEQYINAIAIFLNKYERSSIDAENDIDEEDYDEIENLIKNVNQKVVSHLLKIHSNIFYKVSTSKGEKPNFIKEINNIINDISSEEWINDAKKKQKQVIDDFLKSIPKIGFSEIAYQTLHELHIIDKNLWILYDYNVRLYIRDIIANALYASQLVEEYKMHYIIDLKLQEEDYLRISFTNQTDNNKAEEDSNKMTLLREYFEGLGGKFNNELIDNQLKTNLDIPII